MSDVLPNFDVGAKIDAFVEVGRSIKSGIDRLNDRWKAKPEVLSTRQVAAAISASSGDLLFGLGGPAQGRRRLVRQIVVGGSLFSSTPAGTAYILSEGAQPPLVAPLYEVIDWTTASLPQRAFYGRGELVLDYPEKLWCLIHGPTATTEYVVAQWIEDFELGFGLTEQAP